MPSPAPDSCRNVRSVFLEPGHGLRSVDDTLEGVPGRILQGFWLKSLRCILDEVMQAFVSPPALERFCNCGAGPFMLSHIDNAWRTSFTEPRRGIELETDDIIGSMAGGVNHGLPPFRRRGPCRMSFHRTSLSRPSTRHSGRISPWPSAGSTGHVKEPDPPCARPVEHLDRLGCRLQQDLAALSLEIGF